VRYPKTRAAPSPAASNAIRSKSCIGRFKYVVAAGTGFETLAARLEGRGVRGSPY
jgi:hypothetical protein